MRARARACVCVGGGDAWCLQLLLHALGGVARHPRFLFLLLHVCSSRFCRLWGPFALLPMRNPKDAERSPLAMHYSNYSMQAAHH